MTMAHIAVLDAEAGHQEATGKVVMSWRPGQSARRRGDQGAMSRRVANRIVDFFASSTAVTCSRESGSPVGSPEVPVMG